MSSQLKHSSSTYPWCGFLFPPELSSILKQVREGESLSSEPIMQSAVKLDKFLDRPPIVELETVNICNSKCQFCIAREQVVKKAVMDEGLFDNIALQISELGTGQLCLVPMLGDPLLDDNIVSHASALRKLGNMDVIRLVTNGLAFDRHSDKQLILLFNTLDILEISIGPNQDVYQAMFGVDRFEHLISQLERVSTLMKRVPERPKSIILCGRACGEDFSVDYRLAIIAWRLTGKFEITWTRKYMDWGGY